MAVAGGVREGCVYEAPFEIIVTQERNERKSNRLCVTDMLSDKNENP